MTDAQEAAIKKVSEICREHFSAAVCVFEGEAVNVENPDSVADITSIYHGGYASSIGLIRIAELKVYKMELDQKTES